MSFDALLRNGVKLADKLVKSLEVTVVHKAWVSQDMLGAATYKSPVNRLGLVERTQKQIRGSDGVMVTSNIHITFLMGVVVSTRDIFTLKDGTTGPVLTTNGFIDPKTNLGYVTEVWLG